MLALRQTYEVLDGWHIRVLFSGSFEKILLRARSGVTGKFNRGFSVKTIYSLIGVAIMASLLSSCGTTESLSGQKISSPAAVDVPESYLQKEDAVASSDGEGPDSPATLDGDVSEADPLTSNTRVLAPLQWQPKRTKSRALAGDLLSTETELTVSAEKMPVRDFIHYIFGTLLEVNYVVEKSIQSSVSEDKDVVTLSIVEAINSRDLFRLVSELLVKYEIQIKYGNNTFFLYRQDQSKNSDQVVIGIGRDDKDVPETAQNIMQVVPLQFGVKLTLERTLRSLTKAKITPDFSQSAIFIEGRRDEIIRAIELIDLSLPFLDPSV